MNIAIINDTHFGIRNDSVYFLDKCLNYFESVFFPYIADNNITEIIHLGDFFDRRKYINFNTLTQVRKRFLEKIPNSVNFRIIIGNHDTYYKNTNEINSLKELDFYEVTSMLGFVKLSPVSQPCCHNLTNFYAFSNIDLMPEARSIFGKYPGNCLSPIIGE